MIQANELRHNNWYKRAGKIQFNIGEFDAEPILLTSKILEQCGFKKDNRSSRFYKTPFFIYAPGSPISSFAFGIIGRGRITTMKYVHQLQNIYFAITGEELKIEMETINA